MDERGGGKYVWCVARRGKDHLWAALGFPFARVEVHTGTRRQFLLSPGTGVSRAISGCSQLLGKELILFLCK